MGFLLGIALTTGASVRIPANATSITIVGASIASYAISVDGTNFHSVTNSDDIIIISDIAARLIQVTFTGTAQISFGDSR